MTLSCAVGLSLVSGPQVVGGAAGPFQYHNAVNAAGKDVQMGSITTDSGRTVTDSAVVDTTGLLSPGSHGINHEHSVALAFDDEVPAAGKTVLVATLFLFANATYNASPGTVKIYVSAHDADTPAALNSDVGDLRSAVRPRTAETTVQDITSVTAALAVEIDVTTVIQELLDRPGWTATRIVLLVDTHEDTTDGEWQDFDDFALTAAELDVWTVD